MVAYNNANMLKLLVACLFVLTVVHTSEDVELLTTYGKIVGTRQATETLGNTFYAFKGIRYAEPVQRFEVGQPVLPWNGTYDAREDKEICMQLTIHLDESEDCLYLSVYTPKLVDRTAGLPVMFWVHGGAFVGGGSKYEMYGPDYFIDHDVIVVTINYRLGVFGFLYDDNYITGNLGMKDLILGLQWVKNTIKSFGGDPENVTIFGESSGAALVSYMSTSPLVKNKGYFKRVICQSGSALNTWSLQRWPWATYEAILLATACKTFDAKSSFECLKSRNGLLLQAASAAVLSALGVYNINMENGIAFGVTIERSGEQSAVTEGSYSIFKRGDVPNVDFLMGINSEESVVGMSLFAPAIRTVLMEIDANKKILVPADMYAPKDTVSHVIVPIVRSHYFDSFLIALSSNEDIIRYFSDVSFNIALREKLTLLQNKTNVYCYEFTYASDMGCRPTVFYEDSTKVGHGEDLNYFFRTESNNGKTYPEHDYVVRERMVRMWTNFAKTGNPTPHQYDNVLQNVTWPTSWLGRTNVQCMNIGYNLTIMENPKESGYRFWKRLYDSFGNPKDTY